VVAVGFRAAVKNATKKVGKKAGGFKAAAKKAKRKC
jgi:hypothetical protein